MDWVDPASTSQSQATADVISVSVGGVGVGDEATAACEVVTMCAVTV